MRRTRLLVVTRTLMGALVVLIGCAAKKVRKPKWICGTSKKIEDVTVQEPMRIGLYPPTTEEEFENGEGEGWYHFLWALKDAEKCLEPAAVRVSYRCAEKLKLR